MSIPYCPRKDARRWFELSVYNHIFSKLILKLYDFSYKVVISIASFSWSWFYSYIPFLRELSSKL